jgi:hypothetical protein
LRIGLRGGVEGKHTIHQTSAAVTPFPEYADRFDPAEGLLDQLALASIRPHSRLDLALVQGNAT